MTTNPDSFTRPLGIPVYATQVWHVVANFTVFCLLVLLRRNKKWDGQLMVGYFMLYPIGRISIEFFRGDEIRGFVIPGILSTSQFIGVIMMVVGAVMWWRLRKK